jgi:hypothetical protein
VLLSARSTNTGDLDRIRITEEVHAEFERRENKGTVAQQLACGIDSNPHGRLPP